jgi:2-polyprenyl-6-hydroxyphenyl methylase/3-demethylubiquinone-9 3-methyltransferase
VRKISKNNPTIYDQMDWWDEANALLLQLPIKFNYFLEKINECKNLKILDIGCGGGLLAEEFTKLGAKVVGIDISHEAIKKAKEHANQNNLDIKYVAGEAERLPFSDKFDIVVCADVFEHVNNLDRCISELARILKPGGLLFYDTINKTLLSWFSVIVVNNLMLRIQLKKIGVNINKFSVHEWGKLIKPKELYRLFDKYHINNIESKGLNFAGIRDGNIQLKIGSLTSIAYIGYAQKL